VEHAIIGPPPAENPLPVRFDVRLVVDFKAHAVFGEFIDRLLDIVHREVQD
jgi:hypothetical protein